MHNNLVLRIADPNWELTQEVAQIPTERLEKNLENIAPNA